MTTEQILEKRKQLEKTLRFALTTHEKSDIIKETRKELLALRDICPHETEEATCPYCGQKLS